MRNRVRGFSLVELLVATSLALGLSLALVQWQLQLYQQTTAVSDQQHQQLQFYQLGHWLLRDLQRELNHPGQVQFDPSEQCLRYGEHGVRVRHQQLQWRPEHAACNSSGWQSLHAPEGFRVRHLHWQAATATLCLEGRWRQAEPWHWCQSWAG